jgi:hypothetical protein
MNKSQRIPINPNIPSTDSHILVKLDQEVDTLEFLSMTLGINDVYQDFNADYGVLVGRVIANGGVGIPNAKISIFIPLSDTDANIGEIASIYPYVNPTDKNNDGKRYNLLPRVSQIDPNTGVSSPKQPFGSFPIKPELVTNLEFLNVYKKYYKYTALTNNAGDYMIFGVPTGTQTVHLSVDITDIGKYSMNPAAMVTNLGYSPNLFVGSKIKPSNDLGDLPNIETQEISVDIAPFWGDTTNFTIGITRQDFRIRSVLNNTFVIFGSAFTDGDNAMWGFDHSSSRYIAEMWRIRDPAETNETMIAKRTGKVTEKIYYYPPEITDTMLAINPLLSTSPDPITAMKILDPTQYSSYKRDGDFVFIISCNRNKIITDEFGNETPVSENSVDGIYTRFRGFMTLEITNEDIPMNFTGSIGNNTRVEPYRYKYKFPQMSPAGNSLANDFGGVDISTSLWRREHKIFSGGTIYSVAKFHGTTQNGYEGDDDKQFQDGIFPNFLHYTAVNYVGTLDLFWNVGAIITGTINDVDISDQYEFPSNAAALNNFQSFGAQWMNFSVYFPQVGFLAAGYSYIKDVRGTDNFHPSMKGQAAYNEFFNKDNTQKIAAGDFNTKWFARSDLHWTDFIEVPKRDLLAINQVSSKGFKDNNTDLPYTLTGKYRNGSYIPSGAWVTTACPYKGGKTNAVPTNGTDPRTYFYKGYKTSNCIEYLISLGLV